MHWFVVNHFPPLRTDEGSTGDESESESESERKKKSESERKIVEAVCFYSLVCCKSLSPLRTALVLR